MKIIVNSGNIGTPVAIELAKAGHEVSLTVRKPKPDPALDQLGIKQVAFDLNDQGSLVSALKGHETFFSLTPLVENFIEAGTNTIKAAKAAGVRKIVRAAAQGSAPDAAIELGRWHYAVEKAVEDSGIPFSVLRPANFMQNYLTYGTPETIKAQDCFYSTLADGKISWIDTRDISAVAVKLLVEKGHEGRRYDLTGGESFSNAEAARIFSNLLGRKISHVTIPDEKSREAMLKAGTPAWLTDLIVELNTIGRAGYLAEVKPDTENLLQRKPILFEQFIRDHFQAFRS